MDFSNLKTQTPEQLRELAHKMGIKPHWNAKSETIIKQIIEKAVEPAPRPAEVDLRSKAEMPVTQAEEHTPEEVEALIASVKANSPEFRAEYNLEERTWHFRCRGAEDSGTLNQPLRVIHRRALLIARGRMAIMSQNAHFDSLAVGGKNAYTNLVM